MIDRIVDVSTIGTALRVELNQLKLHNKNSGLDSSIPISEIAVLLLSTPHVSVTGDVLNDMAKNNAILIVCEDNGLPSAMQLPLVKHSVVGERIDLQVEATLPTKKRLWQQIVVEKIRGQAGVLKRLKGGWRQL